MAYIDLNPDYSNVYGPQVWHSSASYWTMNNHNRIIAFQIKTGNWGASKIPDAIWLFAHSASGSPLIMLQFFQFTDQFDPTASTFVADTVQRGPIAQGWVRIPLPTQMRTYSYPSGTPVTGQSMTLQPNTDYWVLVAPSLDSGGSVRVNGSNFVNWKRFNNHGTSRLTPKMRHAFSSDRAANFYGVTDDQISPYILEVPALADEGFNLATSSNEGVEPEASWKVWSSNEIIQYFTPPAALGSIKELEVMVGWASGTNGPDHPLTYRIVRDSTGATIVSGTVVDYDDPRLRPQGNYLVRIKVPVTSTSLLSGVKYRLYLSAAVSGSRAWKVLVYSTRSVNATVQALNWEGASSKAAFVNPSGGTIAAWSDRDSLIPFTLSTVPANPSGFTATPNTSLRRIQLTWTASADGTHDHYDLYRRKLGATTWTLLSGGLTTNSFQDYTIGSTFRYQYGLVDVRANGSQSDYAIAANAGSDSGTFSNSVTIPLSADSNWHFVNNTNPAKNITLTDVQTGSFQIPWEQDEFIFAGRNRKVVERSIDGPLGKDGTVTFMLHELNETTGLEDSSLIWSRYYVFESMWSDLALENVTLIDNHGNAWTVMLRGDIQVTIREDDDRGRLMVTVNWTEVV